MKGFLRLPAVLFLILVAGQTLLFGETNENPKKGTQLYGLRFGCSMLNEKYEAFLILDMGHNNPEASLSRGFDCLSLKFKYFSESEQLGMNLNGLINLSSFLIAVGAASLHTNSIVQGVVFSVIIIPTVLPMVFLNGNYKYYLFDHRLSLDVNTEGDLYYLFQDKRLLFEESVAGGVSVYFNDLLSLQMTAKMVFYSDRFYFDAEHFGLGASLRLSF